MPQGRWTISSTQGGSSGSDLVGCHIVGTATGYNFTAPNNTVLASTTDTTLPFSFGPFDYDGIDDWTVTVSSLANPASGSWSNSQTRIKEEEGTWSAGAGADTDVDEGAASANA